MVLQSYITHELFLHMRFCTDNSFTRRSGSVNQDNGAVEWVTTVMFYQGEVHFHHLRVQDHRGKKCVLAARGWWGSGFNRPTTRTIGLAFGKGKTLLSHVKFP